MTTLIAFIAVLGVLIFIHELGHFIVAKLGGVGVEKFSLGFGPRLAGFTRGETEYKVCVLPLGGYVKMVGESPDDEVSPELKERSFTNKPLSIRAAIVVAGSVMNLALAAVLLPLIFLIGISVPTYLDGPPVVGFVAPDEAAQKAGLRSGDLIVEANGKPVSNWEELGAHMVLNPEKAVKLKVQRDGSGVEITITPEVSEQTGAGIGGFYPPMLARIGGFSSGYPAEKAGLEVGDLIVAIDGIEIIHWAEMERIIHRSRGEEKVFTILRSGETFTVAIVPKLHEEMAIHLIGITRAEDVVFKRYGLIGAVKKGFHTATSMTSRLFMVIKGLILGDYSLKTLGGPIMIAQVAGKAAESGVTDLLYLVAFLSLQLGIINLFPIPVLDGGHLVFYGIEFVRGKPLSDSVMSVAQNIGIALLLALMVVVTFNDIARFFN